MQGHCYTMRIVLATLPHYKGRIMPEKHTGLFEGDVIVIDGSYGSKQTLKIELFRDCLGVFVSIPDRMAGNFTPLCNMYGRGAGSEDSYISNYGEYIKNPVALWAQVPKDTPITADWD